MEREVQGGKRRHLTKRIFSVQGRRQKRIGSLRRLVGFELHPLYRYLFPLTAASGINRVSKTNVFVPE